MSSFSEIIRQPLFSMLACILAFEIGIFINKKTRIALFNPLLIGILFIFFSSYVLGLSPDLIKSLMAKSITTPIGVQVTQTLGGVIPITVVAIIITGITGAIISTFTFKLFRIKNDIAKGVAYGTSCHAMGTSKALETNEIQGGISSLSMGLNGLLVVFIAPSMYHILASLIHLH